MGQAKLELVRKGSEPLIQVFVHGFLNGSKLNRDGLVRDIRAARPAGRTYLYHWPSGANLLELPSYIFKQAVAEHLGATKLRKHICQIPGARDVPINLIGHSLGARLIHWALAENDWSGYRLQHVVMMGSAASRDDSDWGDCARKLSGTLINAHSANDQILRRLRPHDAAGIKALSRRPQIRNVDTSLGHTQYWENLEWVLQRCLGDEYQQHDISELEHDVACPYCDTEYALQPGAYICARGCGLTFEVDARGRAYFLENTVVCGQRRCGAEQSLYITAPDHAYGCADCEAVIWERGRKIPPARQRTRVDASL